MTSSPVHSAAWLGDGRRALRIALVIGLLLRLLILWHTTDLGETIIDEQQYSQIADNLLLGNGFAWGPGDPTSIRPPLYPGLLAAVWSVAGPRQLQVIRFVQILISLATVAGVYWLGACLYNPTVGRYAAAVCWLYPSFIFFNFLILTETLFTFLLVLFVLSAVLLVQRPRFALGAACGVALGLAALTRSVLWPLPLLLCPLLVLLIRASFARRLALSLVVLAGYILIVAPWAVRNTQLQRVLTIVDTMGGINLRMGNYEYTPDDRMWDAVGLTGEKSWVYGIAADLPGSDTTEGMKEKWAQRKAVEYMRAHPGETIRRSLIKFADLWGLEREFMAGVQTGLFTPPQWFSVLSSVCIVLGYIAVALVGGAGLWLAAPADRRMQALLLLPVLVIVGGHTIVFGHSRYHLPLMPFFALYAAAFVVERARSFRWAMSPTSLGAAATATVLIAVWVRQIVFVDLAHITALFHHAG